MMNHDQGVVYAGFDTHGDTHHAAVLGAHGGRLEDLQLQASPAGYREAVTFLAGWTDVTAVGVECTGSYGAALTRALRTAGYRVVEVNRPNRFERRAHGKTDQFDAYSAAEAVLSGRATAEPKGADGFVEALRVLRTTRTSGVRERTATTNQLKAMLIAGPERLRERFRDLSTSKLVTALLASRPPHQPVSADEATAYALKTLAARHRLLTEQVNDLTRQLRRLLEDHAAALMAVFGAGPDTIAQLLITAGDNPDRLRSERQFAALTGACPIPASSGKTNRYRLSRGGDRQANSALYHIIIVRMRHDQATRDYVERRVKEGRGKLEIIRCLKRYLARQLYPLIRQTLHGTA